MYNLVSTFKLLQLVLNTKDLNGWNGNDISTNLPTLEDGKPFKVEIKCLQDGFEIFVNKKVGAFKIYLTSVRCSVTRR